MTEAHPRLSKSKSNQPEYQYESRSALLDSEFISEILRKLKKNELTEQEIRHNFYEYTRNFLELFTNSSNLVDYEKDEKPSLDMLEYKSSKFKKTSLYEQFLKGREIQREKLKKLLGEKHINFVKTLNWIGESKLWNDFELISMYSSLYDGLKVDSQFILKTFLTRRGSMEILMQGFFSDSEEVRKSALKVFELLENTRLIKRLSYFSLFVYQTIKNEGINSNDL